MAGAQVVPIFYHYDEAKLKDLLSKLNGVLFPGGSYLLLQNHEWVGNIKFIVEYAKEQNNQGRTYPIWATCLGF